MADKMAASLAIYWVVLMDDEKVEKKVERKEASMVD